MQTRITPNTVTFNAVSKFEISLYVLHKSIKILTKKKNLKHFCKWLKNVQSSQTEYFGYSQKLLTQSFHNHPSLLPRLINI